MHVFVTGASGFVGSAVVQDLLQAGHTVLGLARTDEAAERLTAAGAKVHRGNIYDFDSLKQGAALCDAVIHTAFNHDFSRFKQNCEDDRAVIQAMGEALAGTSKPLVVTSGVAVATRDRMITEDDTAPSADVMPRAASEEAALALREQGIDAYIVRLAPTTHDKGDHGFVPMLMAMAKDKGESAYVEDGQNHWPAVHRRDAATLYRLIIEKKPAQAIYHAVAEEAIPFKQIAEAIGKGLNLPVVSKTGEAAQAHFTWFMHFASINCMASAEKTRNTLGWNPTHATLMEELVPGIYF